MRARDDKPLEKTPAYSVSAIPLSLGEVSRQDVRPTLIRLIFSAAHTGSQLEPYL